MATQNLTGLQCLKAVFSEVRRGVNFSALLTRKVMQDYEADEMAVLLKLSADHGLRPEQADGLDIFQSYSGPFLAKLSAGNWVLVANSKQLTGSETLNLYDPQTGKESMLSVRTEQFKELFTGKSIIFHNLAQIDARKQTRLTSFIAIAQHHNTRVDIREIMHEYAVGEEEVRERQLRHIAADYKFKSKEVKLSWKKLENAGTVLPCIAIKRSGKYAVLCGMRKFPQAHPRRAQALSLRD